MDLPDPEDSKAVFAYVMTFNAYETLGSFEAAAAIARSTPRSTLIEVRAELFFKARASRHRGDDTYLQLYGELLPLLKHFGETDAA